MDYIVLTSVDRDDLADGGAGHFATTVELLKQNKPALLVECLVSDFAGNMTSVERLATSGLDVYAHNVETVERLQPYVRDRRAGYQQSLATLAYAKQVTAGRVYTKTSLMLGLGETRDEIVQTMRDLRAIDVDVGTCGGTVVVVVVFVLFLVVAFDVVRGLFSFHISISLALLHMFFIQRTPKTVTFGQYLRPTEQHLAVVEYIRPQVFDEYRRLGEEMGFKYVASGPMVRSSYKAGEFFMANMIRRGGKIEEGGGQNQQ